MSSKKSRRRQRREEEESGRGRQGLSPVAVFIVGIVAAVLLTVVGAMVLGNRSDRGDPPWPGAVWSEAHGHWH